MQDRTIMTVPEIMDYLRISRNTLSAMCRRGEIPFFRINKRGDKRFVKEEVMQYFKDNFN